MEPLRDGVGTNPPEAASSRRHWPAEHHDSCDSRQDGQEVQANRAATGARPLDPPDQQKGQRDGGGPARIGAVILGYPWRRTGMLALPMLLVASL
jgi:hypothetical protein